MIGFPPSGEPRTIRSGYLPWWIDDSTMIVIVRKTGKANTYSSWKVPITGGKGIQILQDSTIAFPIDNGKYTVYFDLRPPHSGLWLYNETSKTSRLLRHQIFNEWIIPGSGFGYYTKPDGSLWKTYLPAGKEEKLPGKLPGITLVNPFSLTFSRDGKNIAFINKQSSGRLIMIDNLFK